MVYNRFRASYEESENRPPRKKATALGYEAGKDEAPRVLASGRGAIAEKIIAAAQNYGIPIEHDPFLASALESLDIDEVIPPELYAVVAEVFAYVYRVREKRQQDAGASRQKKSLPE